MEHKDKVVVITGAANGIGAQLARDYAAEGATLALADIDEPNLTAVAQELTADGVRLISEVVDVADADAVAAFAETTDEAFGRVDYCFSNAGVISVGAIWEEPLPDWEWLWGTNVMGTVHMIRAFIPRMTAQGEESHFITTASIAGLLTVENSPSYVASKFAALSLTEVLELQLQDAGSPVKAHAICPAIVKTDLMNCPRHRRPGTWDPDDPYFGSADFTKRLAAATMSMEQVGIPVEEAVRTIIQGVDDGTFYILTHPAYNPAIVGRTQGIVDGVRPSKVRR